MKVLRWPSARLTSSPGEDPAGTQSSSVVESVRMFTVSNMENRCVELETSTALQQGTDQNITTSQRVVSCLMFKGILSKSKVYNIV